MSNSTVAVKVKDEYNEAKFVLIDLVCPWASGFEGYEWPLAYISNQIIKHDRENNPRYLMKQLFSLLEL